VLGPTEPSLLSNVSGRSPLPRRDQYVPKHRDLDAEAVDRSGRSEHPGRPVKRSLKSSLVLSGIAVAVTGAVVTSGVLATGEGRAETAAAELSAAAPATQDQTADASRATDRDFDDVAALDELADRNERGLQVSRSDRRTAVNPAKAAIVNERSGGQQTRTENVRQQDPRSIARAMLPEFGFSADQFGCLNALWVSESDWDPHADNPTSTAYGIPQALTGGTHDNLPADYMTNPAAQIRWGLDYIKVSYGSPCSAWDFKQGNNWY
jgi:hypothetical protein